MVIVRHQTNEGVVVSEVPGVMWRVSQDGKMVEIYSQKEDSPLRRCYMVFNLDFVISVELQEDEDVSKAD